MWIPKTKDELKAIEIKKEKEARVTGVSVALLIFVFETLFSKFIGTRSDGRYQFLNPTLSWTEILNSLSNTLLFSLLFGILIYLLSRKFKQISSLLCDSCGKIKRYDKSKKCDCGGQFVFLDDMKWVDEVQQKD